MAELVDALDLGPSVEKRGGSSPSTGTNSYLEIMFMDLEKFAALTALVREARVADAAATQEMEQARERWKVVNETLTLRMKTLDQFIAEEKAKAIRTKSE